MYTDNPPLICSGLTILQMESVSDHSAVDIAANLTSHGESFFPSVTPFLSERWTSPWTPDILADSHRPQVNAQAGSLAVAQLSSVYSRRYFAGLRLSNSML